MVLGQLTVLTLSFVSPETSPSLAPQAINARARMELAPKANLFIDCIMDLTGMGGGGLSPPLSQERNHDRAVGIFGYLWPKCGKRPIRTPNEGSIMRARTTGAGRVTTRSQDEASMKLHGGSRAR